MLRQVLKFRQFDGKIDIALYVSESQKIRQIDGKIEIALYWNLKKFVKLTEIMSNRQRIAS